MALSSPPPPHPDASSARSTARILLRRGRQVKLRGIAVYGSQIEVWHFLVDNRPELWSETTTHARLVALALLLAVPPAVALGVAAARRPRLAGPADGAAGGFLPTPRPGP